MINRISHLLNIRLYQRYLIKEVILAVLLVLTALLALYSFFDFIGEIAHVGRGNYRLPQALAFVALKLPGRSYELMPIAILIGSLYALTNLARHSEITVLRTSGLSTANILTTLLKLAGVFALLTLIIGETITPIGEKAAQALYLRSTSSLIGQDSRTGVWLKDGLNIINIAAATPDAQLQGVHIYGISADYQLNSVSEAKEGRYVSNGHWQLSEVTRTVFGEKKVAVEKLAQMDWNGALTPDILNVLMVQPERMPLYQLVLYTRHLSDSKQQTSRFEIALWKKLFYPLSALVMIALALPFAYTHNRMSSVSLKIFFGVMTGVFFHMLNTMFSSLGIINSWSPLLSALAPPFIFFLAAVVILWWVERR